MKAEELRIGNIVDYYGNEVTINSINDTDVGFSDYVPIDYPLLNEIKPILLTEEWLVRFGFEMYDYDLFHGEHEDDDETYLAFKINHPEFKRCSIGVDLFVEKQYCSVYKIQNDIKDEDFTLYNAFVPHVHQLQNLYFALFGEELNYEKATQN